jgi:hypothetical protein
LLLVGLLCLPVAWQADTQSAHRARKIKKQTPPPPLPSGTQGPVPQVPLDAIPAVAPQVSYQDGQLTISAPNSTLGDILRGVRKHTAADIEIPASANERVATRLGPGPARAVMAELLNGSHFNYILLGSPENASLLVKVVLVPKTPETPAVSAQTANNTASAPVTNVAVEAPEADVAEDAPDDSATDQATEAEQQPPPEQPGVKTPQQMLQEMQQRQLQLQQQQQAGQPGQPVYPSPGVALPQRPPQPPPQPPQQQE